MSSFLHCILNRKFKIKIRRRCNFLSFCARFTRSLFVLVPGLRRDDGFCNRALLYCKIKIAARFSK
jgi:hypothetical protein